MVQLEILTVLLLVTFISVNAFCPFSLKRQHCSSQLHMTDMERRDFVKYYTAGAFLSFTSLSAPVASVSAADLLEPVASDIVTPSPKVASALSDALYKIVRVREATMQEARLIKSGKFKDVQRANVKLAVKFMIQNYRLNDNFVTAASFLESTKSAQASEVGKSAVQYLYTILEYFDSSDIQNLKVGTFDSMAGKEPLILKGLEATGNQIDQFLSFFPKEEVESVKKLVAEENELNEKEFDVANLGSIGNLSPTDILK